MAALCTGGTVLIASLIFGLRDAWVSARGVNGTVAGGLLIGLFMFIPIVCVLSCVLISRRRGRDRSSTLLRGGLVALAAGIPVALLLIIGAAY